MISKNKIVALGGFFLFCLCLINISHAQALQQAYRDAVFASLVEEEPVDMANAMGKIYGVSSQTMKVVPSIIEDDGEKIKSYIQNNQETISSLDLQVLELLQVHHESAKSSKVFIDAEDQYTPMPEMISQRLYYSLNENNLPLAQFQDALIRDGLIELYTKDTLTEDDKANIKGIIDVYMSVINDFDMFSQNSSMTIEEYVHLRYLIVLYLDTTSDTSIIDQLAKVPATTDFALELVNYLVDNSLKEAYLTRVYTTIDEFDPKRADYFKLSLPWIEANLHNKSTMIKLTTIFNSSPPSLSIYMTKLANLLDEKSLQNEDLRYSIETWIQRNEADLEVVKEILQNTPPQ